MRFAGLSLSSYSVPTSALHEILPQLVNEYQWKLGSKRAYHDHVMH